MSDGLFIVFEGQDGAGKSSHIQPLEELLRKSGLDVVVTREPGGTPLAEQLRKMVLNEPMDPMTEALLVFAARRDHIKMVIEPALAAGKVVICDRFTDSSFAYQGYGRQGDLKMLETLEKWVQTDVQTNEKLQPDLTLWFDISPEVAAQRMSGAGRVGDRFENQAREFFCRVRVGYFDRAKASNGATYRVDAEQTMEEVWKDVASKVLEVVGREYLLNVPKERLGT